VPGRCSRGGGPTGRHRRGSPRRGRAERAVLEMVEKLDRDGRPPDERGLRSLVADVADPAVPDVDGGPQEGVRLTPLAAGRATPAEQESDAVARTEVEDRAGAVERNGGEHLEVQAGPLRPRQARPVTSPLYGIDGVHPRRQGARRGRARAGAGRDRAAGAQRGDQHGDLGLRADRGVPDPHLAAAGGAEHGAAGLAAGRLGHAPRAADRPSSSRRPGRPGC
jgi:hypothetical protein